MTQDQFVACVQFAALGLWVGVVLGKWGGRRLAHRELLGWRRENGCCGPHAIRGEKGLFYLVPESFYHEAKAKE